MWFLRRRCDRGTFIGTNYSLKRSDGISVVSQLLLWMKNLTNVLQENPVIPISLIYNQRYERDIWLNIAKSLPAEKSLSSHCIKCHIIQLSSTLEPYYSLGPTTRKLSLSPPPPQTFNQQWNTNTIQYSSEKREKYRASRTCQGQNFSEVITSINTSQPGKGMKQKNV